MIKITDAIDLDYDRQRILDLITSKHAVRLVTVVERTGQRETFWLSLASLVEEGKIFVVLTNTLLVCDRKGLPDEVKGFWGSELPRGVKIVSELDFERNERLDKESRRQAQEKADVERAEREKQDFELKQLDLGARIQSDWMQNYSARKLSIQSQAEKQKIAPDFSTLEAERREFFKQNWSRLNAGQPLPDIVKTEFGV